MLRGVWAGSRLTSSFAPWPQGVQIGTRSVLHGSGVQASAPNCPDAFTFGGPGRQ